MLHRLAPRTVPVLMVALTVLLTLPSAAPAQVGRDAYTVAGVEVDVTAASAAEARDQAFAEGQRLALERLVEQLAGPGSGINVAGLPPAQIDRMVQGFQVQEERTSPGRYRATLTYVFRPDAVRDLVGDVAPPPTAGPPGREGPEGPRPGGEAAPASAPVVVLPVLRTGDAVRLWDSPNPWHGAWLDREGGGDGAQVIVPFGDVGDVVAIDARRAMAGERAALDAIAANYEAGDVLVALAEPSDSGLVVSTRMYGARPLGGAASFTVPMGGGDARAYAEAVERVVEQLAAAAPAAPEQAVPSGPRRELLVLVPLTSQRDWFQTRSRLRRVPAVAGHEVVSLSAREAVLELDYRGTEDELRAALAREGLALERGPDALELRRTAPSAEVPE
jgi:hypothetical protein